MRNYEVTFIVDPVLSSEEIKATAQAYHDLIKKSGGSIVHVDEMGLRTLAYSINRRNSGIYYCIQFSVENGDFLNDVELAMHRDERVMRFLTVKLEKFGVKYNEDKRNGLINKAKKPKPKKDSRDDRGRGKRHHGGKPKPTPKPEAKEEAKPAPEKAEAKPEVKKEAKPAPAPEKKAEVKEEE